MLMAGMIVAFMLVVIVLVVIVLVVIVRRVVVLEGHAPMLGPATDVRAHAISDPGSAEARGVDERSEEPLEGGGR
jgi:hypothetical protein